MTSPRKSVLADPFARCRTELELASLVREASRRGQRPYADLMQALVGLDSAVEETAAKRLWMAAVEHKRAMSRALGRGVLLRVALLDLLAGRTDPESVRAPTPARSAHLLEHVRLQRQRTREGLATNETLLAVATHEMNRRAAKPAVLVGVAVERTRAAEAVSRREDLEREMALLSRLLTRAAQATELCARLSDDSIVILVCEGGVTRARSLLSKVRRDFSAAGATGRFDLAVAVVNARSGETARDLVARCDQVLSGARTARRSRRAAPGVRRTSASTAVLFLKDPDAVHELHLHLAQQGCLAVPARKLSIARSLFSLLHPPVVFVGNTPEGMRWLKALEEEAPGLRRVRVVGEGAPETVPACGELVVRRPLTSKLAPALLRLAVGKQAAPLDPLSGPRDANRLVVGVERLMEGTLTPAAARAVSDKLEIDVLRRHLGM